MKLRIAALGKPVRAVLITHAHPDHVAGISEWLPSSDTPIYAVHNIESLMRKTEQAKHAQWQPVFKEEWILKWTYPHKLVKDGDQITADDTNFCVVDTGAGGDCDANSIWIMEGASAAAFVGDLIFGGTHSYLADGHTTEWLRNLDKVSSLLPYNAAIYPGHGELGDKQLFEKQKQYVTAYRSAITEIAKGKPSLTESEVNELVSRMKQFLQTEKLEFMIGLSANAVASELSHVEVQACCSPND
jgi:glyoxylase-like metal-dependent hydrolase (beta-lactamase superfamily II)